MAPWCVYIGQKDTQATFADVPGRDMGWMEFATPATYSVIMKSHLLGDFNIDGNRMNSSGVSSSAVYWAFVPCLRSYPGRYRRC